MKGSTSSERKQCETKQDRNFFGAVSCHSLVHGTASVRAKKKKENF
jgi:hypothetical protein